MLCSKGDFGEGLFCGFGHRGPCSYLSLVKWSMFWSCLRFDLLKWLFWSGRVVVHWFPRFMGELTVPFEVCSEG